MVNDVLEDFKSKVGQHIEILELEQFGKSLFIDGEIQVAATCLLYTSPSPRD